MNRILSASFVLVFITLLTITIPVLGDPSPTKELAGRAVQVRGSVNLTPSGESVAHPLAKDQVVNYGDTVETAKESRTAILLHDRSQLVVGEESKLLISRKPAGEGGKGQVDVLNLIEGEIWNNAKEAPDNFTIQTPSAHASVRGTDWFTKVDRNGQTTITVRSGNVYMSNDLGAITISEGQTGAASKDKAPSLLQVVNPLEGTQWTYFALPSLRHVYVVDTNHTALLARLKELEESSSQATTDAQRERALILHDLGRFPESLTVFRELASQAPDVANLSGLALCHLEMGDWRRAEETLSGLAPETFLPLTRIVQALVLLNQNRISEARDLSAEPTGTQQEIRVQQGTSMLIRLMLGLNDEAISLGTGLLSKDPDCFGASTYLTDALLTRDRLQEADALSMEQLSRSPDSALAHYDRGHFLDRTGKRSQEAQREYGEALSRRPLDPAFLSQLSSLDLDLGNYGAPLKRNERALRQGMQNAEFLFQHGRLLSQVRRDREAVKMFDSATRMESKVEGLSGAGRSLLRQGKTDEAIKSLLRSILSQPNVSETHIQLAIAYFLKGRFSDAIEELDLAENLDQHDSNPHIVKSIIYNELRLPGRAIEESRKAQTKLKFRSRGKLDQITATKEGIANIAYSLHTLGLDYWSCRKAQALLLIDPFDPNAHLFPGIIYSGTQNPGAANGEAIQGLLMETTLVEPNRFRTIQKIPGTYLTLKGEYGRQAGENINMESLYLTGATGEPANLDYRLALSGDWNRVLQPPDKDAMLNVLQTGRSNVRSIDSAIGWAPDYRTNLYLHASYENAHSRSQTYSSRFGLPYSFYSPSNDSDAGSRFLEAGFHYRFGPYSHLLIRPYSFSLTEDLAGAGILNPFGTIRGIPSLNLNTTARYSYKEKGIQLKHFFNWREHHQISYGFEAAQRDLKISESALATILPGVDIPKSFSVPLSQNIGEFFLRDQWAITPKVTLDLTSIAEYNWVEYLREDRSLNYGSRVGTVMVLDDLNTLRFGYSENHVSDLIPSSLFPLGQLETNDVAGLLPVELSARGVSSEQKTFKMRWEHEWSPDLFHFAEFENQRITGQGAFRSLLGAVEWIPPGLKKRLGVRLTAFTLLSTQFDHPPFDLDLLSTNTFHLYLKYVHPKGFSAALRRDYCTGKTSQYPTIPSLRGHQSSHLTLSYQPPKRDYLLSLVLLDVPPSTWPFLPGLQPFTPTRAISFEYHF